VLVFMLLLVNKKELMVNSRIHVFQHRGLGFDSGDDHLSVPFVWDTIGKSSTIGESRQKPSFLHLR
jgi:hypothetical protein